MPTRAEPQTEKQRNRDRIAEDLAEFLRRGGVIEQVQTPTPELARGLALSHSPVSAAELADD